MLITPLGEPVPPQSVVKRLAAVDERLTIKWVPSPATGPYWAIVETWRRGDPRWELVQQRQVQEHEAFDILCMLPPDCSAEEAEGILLRRFGRVTDPKAEAEAQMAKVAAQNKAQKAKHVENFLVEQEEKHVRTSKHELEVQLGLEPAHPISHGVGEGTVRRMRRKSA